MADETRQPNWEMLQELLAENHAEFHWNKIESVWCLSGEKDGLLWETDDYPAEHWQEAVKQVVYYLEQDGSGF